MLLKNFHHYRRTQNYYRRKWRKLMFIFLISFCVIILLFFNSPLNDEQNDCQIYLSRDLLSETDNSEKSENKTLNVSAKRDPKFPPDIFNVKENKGYAIFYFMGMIYMFVALAIVCDEFFIPALDVITVKMDISEDVAGATFMAAGGSAPELFTSIIGVFISDDDVGIGTIVGSAVFNILFVISMCAIFSKTVLDLTWWPLFRDVSFYSIILITLMFFFLDSTIFWYEAVILLSWYAGYVLFMKYNSTAENYVKKLISFSKVNKVSSTNDDIPKMMMKRRMSTPILHGGSKFRHGVLNLMIHSIDPLHEEVIKNAVSLQPQSSANNHHIHPPGATSCILCNEDEGLNGVNGNGIFNTTKLAQQQLRETNNRALSNDNVQAEDDEKPEPLDVSWPDAFKKQVTYVVLAPIIIPLWLTLPDDKQKWFAGSFLGSIAWIAIYSYLMVWWATMVGETIGMKAEVMGLTFLAAGTSIPDLITSVLVARKGLGDMAVSSSVGSNIFDVTVGLPFPWLIYTILFKPVSVNSSGMACSILMLFLMLLFVIITIAAFKWTLNVGMAIVMFILYFVFIACSLALEEDVIRCSSIVPFFGK